MSASVTGDEIVLNTETRRWVSHVQAADPGEDDLVNVEAGRRRRLEFGDELAVEFAADPSPEVSVTCHVVGDEEIEVIEHRRAGVLDVVPAYVYLHGGAFWHGSARERTNASLSASRAELANVATFAVEYRKAPEHPYPAAIDDVIAVLQWLSSNAFELGIDASRIVLGGVSAGANIAAATVSRLPEELALSGLILEVPAIDLRTDGTFDARFAEVNGLNSPAEMAEIYAPDLRPWEPELSPALIEDATGYPDTHIVTAEYDPLRGGGDLLATRLRAAGVCVTGTRHFGALHGSLGLTARDPIALAWQDDVCSALRRLTKSSE